MTLAKILNVAWIVWVFYVLVAGFRRFDEPHVHSYVYFFFAGIVLILSGSIWLKILDLRKQKSSLVRIGYGLWLGGFLALVLCIFSGAQLTTDQFVRAHVIFDHSHFLTFLVGLIVSVYVDTIIVIRLDKSALA